MCPTHHSRYESTTRQRASAIQPLAVVRSEPLLHLPQNLCIPTDALEFYVETFARLLYFLLYPIRRQHLND